MIITRIWRDQPGKYFCLSTKSRSGKWEDHFFKRSQFKSLKDFVEENRDKDLYFCPHGFRKPRRLKENAEMPKLLWADLDEVDPRELKDMPTVAWESSPGRFAAVWVLDRFSTESLNRRFTYAVGADKGGWDVTQVLRLPGTINYKYTSTPKVRLMWADGPTHYVEQIEKGLPKERKVTASTNAAMSIYKKYEKTFSPFVRRELLKGKPKQGKRSQVFWKLTQEIMEAGATQEEAFELLSVSPWNKFRGRRDADQQLRRELDKALDKHLVRGNIVVVDDSEDREVEEEEDAELDEEDEDGAPYKFLSRSMDDVEEENIDWIWYPYVARGELTIVEGDPGLGKSYLAQMVAKGIVDGERLPSVKRLPIQSGKVAYFDIENSAGSVTKKRLKTNGCKNLKNFYQEEEPFVVSDEDTIERVYKAIDALRPTLVVFDTLNTYMGKTDTNSAAETQQYFKIFREIAKRFNCAVMVLRHLTKSTKEKALYRGQGSIAFAGLARVVITVGLSPDDPGTRVMAVTKINVTRPPKALTFTIEALPDQLKETDRSKFHWGEFVDLNADDIVMALPAKSYKDKSEEIEQFLEEILDDGPVESDAVRRAAEARSIGLKSLYKVAEAMGVKMKKKGFGKTKKGFWSLPTVADKGKATRGH